jgi:hypothetical protein
MNPVHAIIFANDIAIWSHQFPQGLTTNMLSYLRQISANLFDDENA